MDLSTPPSSAATNLIDPTNNTNTNQTASFQTTSTSPINTQQQHVSTVDAVDIAKNQTTIVSSMPSNKKVTIAQPTLQAKQSLHGFSPSESGKSGSSFSQSKITLRTCCGVVELTSMKLACLIGMVVTVVGLLILAAIAIASFVTASSKSTDILIGIGEVSTLFESSNAYVFRYVYTNAPRDPKFPEVQLGYYNQTQIAQNLLVNILAKLDNAEVKYVFNETTIQALNSIARENVQILVYFNGDQSEDARRKLVAPLYTETISSFRYGLDQIIEFIQTKEKEKDTQILAVTLVQLIVIVVSLFVVMPIIIFVFTYAINRDSLYLEKIRRANAIMLMDTMEDDGLRALFKLHCEKEKSSENYLLLEKIQFYRSLCERSLELQAKLFKDDPNSDASSDISAESASSAAKKKKESPLEREYNEVEAKKYEVAFEIFTEFLEVTGDMAVNISHVLVDSVKDKLDKFNDKQLDTLPDDMFNVLEKETCLVMMDTHHRFKQSLAFQREMKIDKIKVDKLKKKKLPDF